MVFCELRGFDWLAVNSLTNGEALIIDKPDDLSRILSEGVVSVLMLYVQRTRSSSCINSWRLMLDVRYLALTASQAGNAGCGGQTVGQQVLVDCNRRTDASSGSTGNLFLLVIGRAHGSECGFEGTGAGGQGGGSLGAMISSNKAEQAALRDSEERLRIALESAELGTWDYHIETDEVSGDDRARDMFGLRVNYLRFTDFLNAVHPGDREKVDHAVREALGPSGTGRYHMEHRVLWPNGELRWVSVDGKAHFRGQGDERHAVRFIGTVMDITERKASEAALQQAQCRSETILRSITDAFITYDHEWRFTYLNAEAERLLRKPAIELLGHKAWDVFPDAENFRRELEKAVATGQAVHFEEFYAPFEQWAEVHAYPSEEGLSVYFRDITDRKRTDQALQRNERRLRVLFDSDMVGTLDGRITGANDKFLKTIGYTRNELMSGGIRWRELTPAEFRPADEQALAQLKATGVDIPYEKEFIRKDGSRVPVIIGAAMLDELGQEGVAFVLDNTARKQAEIRLARDFRAVTKLQEVGSLFVREGDLQAVLERIVEAAIDISKADFGNIQLFDPDSGLRIAANRGFPQWYVDYWNEVTANHGSCGTALAAGKRVIVGDVEKSPIFAGTEGLEFQRRAGVRAVQSTPIMSRAGKPLGMFSTHFKKPHEPTGHTLKLLDLLAGLAGDIIERAQIQHDLRRAKERLGRAKEDLEEKVRKRTAELEATVAELEGFSYSLVHDMRAPLRAMLGYSSILETDAGPRLRPEEADLLRKISQAAMRMDQLVTDSLNFSKILRADLPLGTVNLGALIRGMVEAYPNLQRPQAEISVELDNLLVHGNEAALLQIFSNLLGNAVKFVAAGVKPRVRVWAERGDCPKGFPNPEHGCAFVWVEDNGIGIPKEAHEKIFGMFQRLHRVDEYAGTGIGLALVKKSLERTRGQITLESEPGKGTRFCVQLPLAAPPRAEFKV